jgi:hypothetical protein
MLQNELMFSIVATGPGGVNGSSAYGWFWPSAFPSPQHSRDAGPFAQEWLGAQFVVNLQFQVFPSFRPLQLWLRSAISVPSGQHDRGTHGRLSRSTCPLLYSFNRGFRKGLISSKNQDKASGHSKVAFTLPLRPHTQLPFSVPPVRYKNS